MPHLGSQQGRLLGSSMVSRLGVAFVETALNRGL